MRRFVYCKVVLATSLMWVLVDVFLLLYFSECNKCDDKKERSLLPALRGKYQVSAVFESHRFFLDVFGLTCVPLYFLNYFSDSDSRNTRL